MFFLPRWLRGSGSYLQSQALHLRPRSQGLPSPAHPSLPSSLISSLLAPSHQLQLKHSRKSPDIESGDQESDPALTLNKCMILDKISHLAEPRFPYLKTGFLKVMNSTFSPTRFSDCTPILHLCSIQTCLLSLDYLTNSFNR